MSTDQPNLQSKCFAIGGSIIRVVVSKGLEIDLCGFYSVLLRLDRVSQGG